MRTCSRRAHADVLVVAEALGHDRRRQQRLDFLGQLRHEAQAKSSAASAATGSSASARALNSSIRPTGMPTARRAAARVIIACGRSKPRSSGTPSLPSSARLATTASWGFPWRGRVRPPA